MVVDARFNRCQQLLDQVNPKTHSLTMNSDNTVGKETKSFITNFIRWFIHLISFKHFPVNAKLDSATQSILAVTSVITKDKTSNDQEKRRVVKNLEKLVIICEENGGCETEKIKKLILTIRKTIKVQSQRQLQAYPAQPKAPEPISLSPLGNFAKKAFGSLIKSIPGQESPDAEEMPTDEVKGERKPLQINQIPEIEAKLNKASADYPENLEQLAKLCKHGMKDDALLMPKAISYSIELADILAKTNEEAAWPHYFRALKVCKERGGGFDSHIQPLENKLAPIFYKLIDEKIQLLTDATTPAEVIKSLAKLLENVLSIACSNNKYILYSAAFYDVFSENIPIGRLKVAFLQKLPDLYKQSVDLWDRMIHEMDTLLKNQTDFTLHLKKRIANKYHSLGNEYKTKEDVNQAMIHLEKALAFNQNDSLVKQDLFEVYLAIILPKNQGLTQQVWNRLSSWSPGKDNIPLMDNAIKLMPKKFGPHIQEFIKLYEINKEYKKAASLYRKWPKESLIIDDKTKAALEKRQQKAKKAVPKVNT